MNELGPEARRLLELARNADDPDAPTQARVEQALASRIALGAGTASAAAAVKSGSPLLGVKGLLALGALGAIGGAAWLSLDHPRAVVPAQHAAAPLETPGAPSSATTTAASPSTTAATAPLLAPGSADVAERPTRVTSSGRATTERRFTADGAATTSSEPRSSGVRSPAPVPRTPPHAEQPDTPSPPRVDSLQAEAAALRSAQGALRGGDARRALELLAEQEVRFGGGGLAEERAAARVLALCQAHERTAARSEAQRFAQRYPASALLGKVRAACRDE